MSNADHGEMNCRDVFSWIFNDFVRFKWIRLATAAIGIVSAAFVETDSDTPSFYNKQNQDYHHFSIGYQPLILQKHIDMYINVKNCNK